ncbi:hypothetical protein [Limnohabitans sp.]|uniref:hypothetical protein n=1 Tax=Limnohabitans sp. TaxID=1907725 RepID=UPI0037BFD2A0
MWVDPLGTKGPMDRTVRNLARLLATQSGHDARQPLSIKVCVDVSGLQYSHHAACLRSVCLRAFTRHMAGPWACN